MNGLHGKVAFVTHATSDYGRAVALSLARRGANIAAFDRWSNDHVVGSTASLLRLKREVEQMGVRCLTLCGDTMKETDVMIAVAETFVEFRRIDILFNDATVQTGYIDFTSDDPDNASFKRMWLAARYVIPRMLTRGGGTIITCAADTAGDQRYGWTLYRATYPFDEVGYEGIKINAICPEKSEGRDTSQPNGWEQLSRYPNLVNAVCDLVVGGYTPANTASHIGGVA